MTLSRLLTPRLIAQLVVCWVFCIPSSATARDVVAPANQDAPTASPLCLSECARIFPGKPRKPTCSKTRTHQEIRRGSIVNITSPVHACEEKYEAYERHHSMWMVDNALRLRLKTRKLCISWCEHVVSLRDSPLPDHISRFQDLLEGAVLNESKRGDATLSGILAIKTTGILEIFVDTPGAEIVIGGRVMETRSRQAPMKMSVQSGENPVIVRGPPSGNWPYRQWNGHIRVAVGETVHLDAELTPIYGKVSVTVPEQSLVRLSIDGETVAAGSGTVASDSVLSGPHRLTIHADGFAPWSRPITVVDGQVHNTRFPEDVKGARLTITSDPEGIAISLVHVGQGRSQRFTDEHTPTTYVGLDSSTYRIIWSGGGHRVEEQEIQLAPAEVRAAHRDMVQKDVSRQEKEWTLRRWKGWAFEPLNVAGLLFPLIETTQLRIQDGGLELLDLGSMARVGISYGWKYLRLGLEFGLKGFGVISNSDLDQTDDYLAYSGGFCAELRLGKDGFLGATSLHLDARQSLRTIVIQDDDPPETGIDEIWTIDTVISVKHRFAGGFTIAPKVRHLSLDATGLANEGIRASVLFAGLSLETDLVTSGWWHGEDRGKGWGREDVRSSWAVTLKLYYDHGIHTLSGDADPEYQAGVMFGVY